MPFYHTTTPFFYSMIIFEYSFVCLFSYPIVILPSSSIILLCLLFNVYLILFTLFFSIIILFIYRVGGDTWCMRMFALLAIVATFSPACRANGRDPFCLSFYPITGLLYPIILLDHFILLSHCFTTRACHCITLLLHSSTR